MLALFSKTQTNIRCRCKSTTDDSHAKLGFLHSVCTLDGRLAREKRGTPLKEAVRWTA